MKFLIKTLLAVLLAIVLAPFALIFLYYISKWTDNFLYARKFLDDKVEIVRVIASKRWLDYDEWSGCTYAAVEFSEESAATLRDDGPKAPVGRGWQRVGFWWHWGEEKRWNVNWQPTPVEERAENRPDPFYECLKYLSEKDAASIMHGLQTEGSWYFRGSEEATFLSAESRIAALLRYGD